MKRLCLGLWLFFMMSSTADAYVDPGTGMLAIQGLIAVLVSVAAFIANPIRALRNLFARWRKKGDA